MMDDICSFLAVKYIGSTLLNVLWINIAVCVEMDGNDDRKNISIGCTCCVCEGRRVGGRVGAWGGKEL